MEEECSKLLTSPLHTMLIIMYLIQLLCSILKYFPSLIGVVRTSLYQRRMLVITYVRDQV